MTLLPADFKTVSDEAWRRVCATPGYLAEREARFLILAAACAPATGAIVEIGSFKGRATVGLAYICQRYGLGKVVAIDPHTSPSETDPDLSDKSSSSYDDFVANLRRAGVERFVDSQRMLSREFARTWNQPIRLLWIDGDHSYAVVNEDLELFRQHLAPGGVLVMHDVLGTWEGPLRVFIEHVLGSDDFGPAGFCGSIGWGQYRPVDGSARRFRRSRRRLAWPARRLVPVATGRSGHSWAQGWRYKMWRALAPHQAIDPVKWVVQVALPHDD